jgi:hypothetical protein
VSIRRIAVSSTFAKPLMFSVPGRQGSLAMAAFISAMALVVVSMVWALGGMSEETPS